MNHVAFDVSADKMEEYRERLIAKGIKVTEIYNHDDSPAQVSPEVTDDVFVRSIYFFDPDGILLEFAAWTRELTAKDVAHQPATPADRERYVAIGKQVREAMKAAR